MEGAVQLLGVLLVVVLLNAALLAYAARLSRSSDGFVRDASGVPGADVRDSAAREDRSAEDGVVECAGCGERNESEYRYCRHCVSPLRHTPETFDSGVR